MPDPNWTGVNELRAVLRERAQRPEVQPLLDALALEPNADRGAIHAAVDRLLDAHTTEDPQ